MDIFKNVQNRFWAGDFKQRFLHYIWMVCHSLDYSIIHWIIHDYIHPIHTNTDVSPLFPPEILAYLPPSVPDIQQSSSYRYMMPPR